jgi:succinate dehydrogenase/fumarate reductase-like Fe-S protein
MNPYITARVFRYNAEKDSDPYFQEYQFKVDEKMTVLSLLNDIQTRIDPTLSFRNYCCGLQMCRSCLMKINRKKKFACLTWLSPGDDVTIEPVTFPENHIKDLVTKVVQ